MTNGPKNEDPFFAKLGLSSNVPDLIDDQDESRVTDLVPVSHTQLDVFEEDIAYTRDNLRSLIKTGKETLKNLTDLANRAQSIGAFSAATDMYKAMLLANRELSNLAIARKELALKQSGGAAPQTVNNNVFVGSTSDILDLLDRNGEDTDGGSNNRI